MQIVINVPEEVYRASQIMDVKHEDTIQIPLEVIAKGTPLPKGHGRLIDADKYRHLWVDTYDSSYGDECAKLFKGSVDNAETVIEADGDNVE